MFTLYIHILEVLAMHAEGTTASKIMSMGSEYSTNKIVTALRSLQSEGFVIADQSGPVNIWQVTEKAIEYVETVSRKYSASHVMDAIADYVASAEMVAQEAQEPLFTERVTTSENVASVATTEGFLDVSEKYHDLSVLDTEKCRCNWCGELKATTTEPFCAACRSFSNSLEVVKKETSWMDDITDDNVMYEHRGELGGCDYCGGLKIHDVNCPYNDTSDL